jgi:hypothetical protein
MIVLIEVSAFTSPAKPGSSGMTTMTYTEGPLRVRHALSKTRDTRLEFPPGLRSTKDTLNKCSGNLILHGPSLFGIRYARGASQNSFDLSGEYSSLQELVFCEAHKQINTVSQIENHAPM